MRLTKLQQGLAGVGDAIAYFTDKGCVVSIPLADTQHYDLVIEEEGILKRVQVKTTSCIPKGRRHYWVELCTKKSKGGIRGVFNPSAVDYLYVLTVEGDRYLIPTKNFKVTSTLCLGAKYAKFLVE